jgi:Integrase core domain
VHHLFNDLPSIFPLLRNAVPVFPRRFRWNIQVHRPVGQFRSACGLRVRRRGGRKRDECLNETLFTSLAYARFGLAAWRHDYTTVRPHSKLGRKTAAEIVGQSVWEQSRERITSDCCPSQGNEDIVDEEKVV